MNILIIEDDLLFCETLESVIIDYFPNVNINGKASTVKDGIELIKNVKPDLILLDINLPDGTGFDILENTKELSFSIIYITAFIEYAEESYNYPALHFISKANMSYEKLKTAFDRYFQTKSNDNINDSVEIAKEKFLYQPEKLKLRLKEGNIEIKFCDIIYCEADDKYTKIHLINSKTIISSKNLQCIEEKLNTNNFIRIHRSYLINFDHFKLYKKGVNYKVILENSIELSLSRGYKTNFFNHYKIHKSLK